MITPNVVNEYGKLKKVLICKPCMGASIEEMKILQRRGIVKNKEMFKTVQSFIDLEKVLTTHGVEVLQADATAPLRFSNPSAAMCQHYIRDPFAVIGDKMLICHGTQGLEIREEGIRKYLNQIARQNIIRYPQKHEEHQSFEDAYLDKLCQSLFGLSMTDMIDEICKTGVKIEGGDLIVHNDKLFVGQDGRATTKEGLEFIEKSFGDKFKIIPIKMLQNSTMRDPYDPKFGQIKGAFKNQPYMHLDLLFNPISKEQALLYPNGIAEESLSVIKQNFDTINVNDKEQEFLGTNVLSVGDNTVISQKRHTRINSVLRQRGFLVEELDWSEGTESGGPRCATAPLVREA